MKTNTTASRMAVTRQSLTPAAAASDKVVKYKGSTGADVELSIALTKQYFCPQATDAEAYIFNNWCCHVGLDPWKREAYLVKYGGSPAQMLIAKDAFTKRAEANPRFQGQKAGVIVINRNGELENRMGELVLEGEELVGGWADVYVKDYVTPISSSISFRERCQYKDGKPMAKWATSPGLMIRKCALTAALREAFPNDVGGMYVPEEMGFEESEQNASPITPPNIQNGEFTDIDPETGEVVGDDSVQESFFGEG